MSFGDWKCQAAHRLRQHIMRQTIRGRDYSPDTTYEMLKRGQCGPKSLQIAGMLQHWADLWAADARECAARAKEGFALQTDLNAQWKANMDEADAEIDRFTASYATRGAA